jgi:molybdenum cofactor biosynthesis enzyme MoaA
VSLFGDANAKDQVEKSITSFCKEKLHTIDSIRVHFLQLHQELSPEEDFRDSTAITGRLHHLKPPEEDLYPSGFHELLLVGVRDHAFCSKIHKIPLSNDRWHVTQLCLNSGVRLQGHQTRFNIVTANSNETYWQEMAITVHE